jgi:hypothetical protein
MFSMFHSHHFSSFLIISPDFSGFLLGFEAWAWLSSAEPRLNKNISCSDAANG